MQKFNSKAKKATRVSLIEREVNGIPVLMTEFGYKTFTMVVKSLGYLTKKTSPTYFRTSGVMETLYGQPQVSVEYPQPSIKYIIDLYENCPNNGYENLIISPGLEMACYLGRVLNAPILPSQFIASAPDLRFVEERISTDNIYVVGYETDWPDLCVWIKPVNLGHLYAEIINQAKNVIIFGSNQGKGPIHGTSRIYSKGNISINGVDFHAKENSHYRALLDFPEKRGYCKTNDMIPHWEFSMEDEQILLLQKYCHERNINTATIHTGDWSCFIPAVSFAKLYEKNFLRPEGITFHNYWACHPYYEAEFLRIPVYNFQYGADTFLDHFRKWLNTIPFYEKTGEYLTSLGMIQQSISMDTASRFESWGFKTIYQTDRPYDVWQNNWDNFDDLKNPTREWIVPKLKEGSYNRKFKHFLTFEEVVSICQDVNKTDVFVSKS